jgi:hypothetical protein
MNISASHTSPKQTASLFLATQGLVLNKRSFFLAAGSLIAWILLLSMVAYQWSASVAVDVGDYYDTPYLSGAYSEREKPDQRTFRWSTGPAGVTIPDIGRGAWVAQLNVLTAHPDGAPVEAVLHLSDGNTIKLPDTAEPRVIHQLIPASATNSGSLEVEITSNLYQEQTASARTLGVAVFGFGATTASSRPWFPPFLAFGLLCVIGLGAALSLRLTGLAGAWAVGGAAAITAGLIAQLMLHRTPTVFWLPGLAVLSWVTVGLVAGLRKIVPWLCAKGGVDIDQTALTTTLLLFTAGFWLKAGGALYPYMIAIDVHWHMDRVRWILDGRLGEMYRPGAFNESVMPANEFGANRPTIPYSPFFHIFATSFAIFPWALETTAKVFSAVVDNSRVFIIYFLARSFGLSRRAGLLGAALYAVLPATFLLHSWGNVPTTFGMWWTLISSSFIVGAWGRLRERKVFIWLTALLLITFLIYTVMAVFMGMVLTLLIVFVATQHRDQRPQAWALSWAMALAFGLSIAIYYGLYIPDIVRKTIPYFQQSFTQGAESVGATPYQATWADNVRAYTTRLWNNGLMIPLLLTPLAIWRLGRQKAQSESKLWLGVQWICAMFFVALIFVPIDRTVPMVDKHVFFLMPVWGILIGYLFDQAVQRWRWSSILIASGYAALLIAALVGLFGAKEKV